MLLAQEVRYSTRANEGQHLNFPRLHEGTNDLGSVAVHGIHHTRRERIAEGFQFCALASELRYMLSGLRADLAELNWTRAEMAEIGDGIAGATVRY